MDGFNGGSVRRGIERWSVADDAVATVSAHRAIRRLRIRVTGRLAPCRFDSGAIGRSLSLCSNLLAWNDENCGRLKGLKAELQQDDTTNCLLKIVSCTV